MFIYFIKRKLWILKFIKVLLKSGLLVKMLPLLLMFVSKLVHFIFFRCRSYAFFFHLATAKNNVWIPGETNTVRFFLPLTRKCLRWKIWPFIDNARYLNYASLWQTGRQSSPKKRGWLFCIVWRVKKIHFKNANEVISNILICWSSTSLVSFA